MLLCLSTVMAKQEIESETAGSLQHASFNLGVVHFYFWQLGQLLQAPLLVMWDQQQRSQTQKAPVAAAHNKVQKHMFYV